MFRAYFAQVPLTDAEPLNDELSDYRHGRLGSIRNPAQRRLSLEAELLLIRSLKTLGEVCLPLDIFVEDGGKPRLRDGPCFSLSHSGQQVFCALSDSSVGADVQKIVDKGPGDRMLERCLSERERQIYETIEDKELFFTLLWSLKESYAKLDGAGLGPLHPAEICIEFGPPGLARVDGTDAKLWYHIGDAYVFTVCSGKYAAPELFEELSQDSMGCQKKD